MPHLVFNEQHIETKRTGFLQVTQEPISFQEVYRLNEVEEAVYPYPDHEDEMNVTVYESKLIGTFKKGDQNYELVKMLFLNQQAILRQMKYIPSENWPVEDNLTQVGV